MPSELLTLNHELMSSKFYFDLHLSNKDYHAMKDKVSNSMLSDMAKSPAYCFYNMCNTPDSKTQEAFDFGSLVHCLILEEEKLNDEFFIYQKPDRRTKQGKAFVKEKLEPAQEQGLICINDRTYNKAIALRARVWGHKQANALINNSGYTEVSFFGYDDETGQELKWRCDKIFTDKKGRGWIVDLKTSSNASPEGFAKSCANFNYHMQAAYYLDNCNRFPGLENKFKGFIFIVVEKEAPFNVACYQLDLDSIELGRQKYQDNLQLFAQCSEAGFWPSYNYDFAKSDYQIEEISLPRWAFYD